MALVARRSRADWGAGPLRSGHVVDAAQFTALRVHHTVMVMPDYDRDGHLHGDIDDIDRYMRALQAARPDLGSEVPYSFVVFPGEQPDDFIIADGRGAGVTGAHTRGQNSSTYGVVLPGNYEIEEVTPGQVAGVRFVGATELHNPGAAGRTLGHREVPGEATACPGANTMPLLPLMQPPFTAADVFGSGGAPLPPIPEGESDMWWWIYGNRRFAKDATVIIEITAAQGNELERQGVTGLTLSKRQHESVVRKHTAAVGG